MPLNKKLFPIFLIVFIDILGFTVILPLLPFYAQAFGASPLMVGFLVSSFALCQFIAGPFLGQLSDRVGRRPVLLISQAGSVLGYLILAYANNLGTLFLGRVIDGLTAGNITVAQAAIADETQPEERVRAYGLIGIAFGLGFLLGPALSAFLAHYGPSAPLLAAAGLAAASFVLTAILLPARPARPSATPARALFDLESARVLWREPEMRRALILFFVFSLIFSSFVGGLALFAERRFTWQSRPFGAREVGFLLSGLGLYGAILQGGIIGKLNDLWGENRLVQRGFMACAAGFSLLAIPLQWLGSLPAFLISGFGTGSLRPALSSWISREAGRDREGLALGVSQSLGSIAQIAGPLWAGFLIEHQWLAAWCFSLSALSVVGMGLAARGARRIV